ncbi:MAG: MaoC family dehydratase N-terminal domain-containing protein [Chloroflexi bacterium]|nr:MaoC family dehydratase N-terminal domain-containing protein [Chloroflexota bacterium]
MTTKDALPEDLGRLIGQETDYGPWGPDAVNAAMIRHWCEGLEDGNPLYTDEEFARKTEYGGIIAPPTMAQTFARAPFWPPVPPEAGLALPFVGYESLVQRNNLVFRAPLRPGDKLRGKSRLDEISPPRTTRVGTGHFVTTTRVLVNQRGEVASEWSLTVLRYPRGSPVKQETPAPQRAAATAPPAPKTVLRARNPQETIPWNDVREGNELPAISKLPVTVTRLVMLANATRDFYAVHHDKDYARANGARDIFVNNTGYSGFFNRCVTDWFGPLAKLRKLDFSMREMNCPGDILSGTGRVTKKHTSDQSERLVDASIVIANQRGPTTTATATIGLP